MNLDELLVPEDEGATLALKDAAGRDPLLQENGKPVTIRLAGADSVRWRKAVDAVGDRRRKAANPRNGMVAKTTDEERGDAASLLASVTLAWDGIAFDGGEKECNFANAKALYSHPKLGWIASQVDEFLTDRSNFLRASSTT